MNANESLVYNIVPTPVEREPPNLLSGSIFAIPVGVNDPELSWKLLRFASLSRLRG